MNGHPDAAEHGAELPPGGRSSGKRGPGRRPGPRTAADLAADAKRTGRAAGQPRTEADIAADAKRTGRAADPERPTELAQLLHDARQALDLSPQIAAYALGCSVRQLYTWEAGEATPGARRLWRICQALGLDPAELLQLLARAPKAHTPRKDR